MAVITARKRGYMITITKTPMTMTTSYIAVFNQYNQQIAFISKSIDNIKIDKYVNQLRKKFMRQGQSILFIEK